MLRDAIRSLVRKRLGDINGVYWTDTEVHTMINNACADISFRTKCVRTNGYLTSNDCTANTTSAASQEYSLADNFTNIYSVLEVYFMVNGTRWEKLDSITRDDLNDREPGWRQLIGYTYTDTAGSTTYNYTSQPSIPTDYYWDREEDVIGLHPPPNSTNAGSDYIRVYYATKHTNLTSNTAPTIPEPLHLAVVDHCVSVGNEDRGYGEKANDYWKKYLSKLHDYKVERQREREDDEVIMVPHRNL